MRASGSKLIRRNRLFTLINLFNNGEQGVWYDPSDLTTMFSDQSGIIPVATPGSGSAVVVGCILDKRSANYSTWFDGIFGDYIQHAYSSQLNLDNNNWTIEGWLYPTKVTGEGHILGRDLGSINSNLSYLVNLTNDNLRLFLSSNGTTYDLFNGFSAGTVTANQWVHFAFTRSGTTIRAFLNGTLTNTTTITNTALFAPTTPISIGGRTSFNFYGGNISNLRILNGTALYTSNFTPPTSPLSPIANTVLLTCGTTWTGNTAISKFGDARIDSLNPFSTSLGNYATSVNATSMRPELRARVNMLERSEEFDNPFWFKANLTIASNVTLAPDGTTTADGHISTNGTLTREIRASVVVTGGVAYRVSLCLKYEPAGNSPWVEFTTTIGAVRRTWVNTQTGAFGTIAATHLSPTVANLGNGWFRFSFTYTPSTSGTDTLYISSRSANGNSGNTTANGTDTQFYLWGADFRTANIGNNVPVYQRISDANTYDAVGFPYYLLFDGVDDFMFTPNTVNFSATNKMTIVAGLRKQSDAGAGVVVELISNTTNGVFLLSAPNSAAANYNLTSKGTTQVDNTITTFPAPITHVLTGQIDISTPLNSIRVNGLEQSSITTSQGTGNFANNRLYIGRRNDFTSSFNGRLYGLIIRGASTTITDIVSTERFMAQETGDGLYVDYYALPIPSSEFARIRNTNLGTLSDTLTTPSGTYPGVGSFTGGVLLQDGRVFMIPWASTTARIYNPVTDSVTTPSGTYPTNSFLGGVLLPDGRVFLVPRAGTSARIYNPVTDTLTTPSGTYSGGFYGGVLLQDGRVFCVPYSSTTARIYDPVTDTLTTPSGTYPTNSFIGGVLLQDGRVFLVPHATTTARIYDPVTDTLTTPSGTYPSSDAFVGGVLLPDGRVFCVPYNSTTARIYDPARDTLTTPSGTYPSGNAFVGGVLLPDGKVFCVPASSTSGRIYDPATDTLTFPTGTFPGSTSFYGGVLLRDGRVFFVPFNSTTSRIYGTSVGRLPIARVLNPYDNRF